ncbi:hypothetical protein LTR27_009462 [Elasticomyces elasticus]|nr:hypothetical protein LTR27_009462 [Elasticomyces elasticus]
MATPGLLTTSGMLYEGNHASWAERMQAILEMHNIRASLVGRVVLYVDNEGLDEDELSKATTLITNYVSEHILSRISNSGEHDPDGLLDSLRTLAKSFRFNDLPPELRGRVYNIWFKSAQRYTYKLRNNLKYLRQLSVRKEPEEHFFQVRYGSSPGLTVDFPPFCPAGLREGWKNHIAESQLKTQALGSLGEAVVLAVLRTLHVIMACDRVLEFKYKTTAHRDSDISALTFSSTQSHQHHAMADIGNITKAGWLYEGNHSEWEERIEAMKALTVFKGPLVDHVLYEARVCSLMSTNITPYFLARIPDDCRSSLHRFNLTTSRHAQPFPLLKLPAEIRLQVYGHFFDHHVECMEGRDRTLGLSVNEDGKLDKDAIPSILAASQAIRREALPVFISHSIFIVNTGSDKIGPSLCRWTKNGLKSGARLLRKIRIPLRYEPDEDDFDEDTEYESWWGHIELSFTPQK